MNKHQIDKYCPDCVEKLKSNRKQLGSLTRWLVCPLCGYRVRENSIIFETNKAQEEFELRINTINSNQNLYNEE